MHPRVKNDKDTAGARGSFYPYGQGAGFAAGDGEFLKTTEGGKTGNKP